MQFTRDYTFKINFTYILPEKAYTFNHFSLSYLNIGKDKTLQASLRDLEKLPRLNITIHHIHDHISFFNIQLYNSEGSPLICDYNNCYSRNGTLTDSSRIFDHYYLIDNIYKGFITLVNRNIPDPIDFYYIQTEYL